MDVWTISRMIRDSDQLCVWREQDVLEDFGLQAGRRDFAGEVCVVGGGAAGVVLADALSEQGHDVILLESGGLDYDPATQDMMRGENTGFHYYDLGESRLRFLGGTTTIWGGRCAQLNGIDFERRSWVAHSGWPISKYDLAPWYARAQRAFDLDETEGEDELWERHGLTRPPWAPDVIGSAFWQFDGEADRFAHRYARRIRESAKVRILLHATATEILLDACGMAVRGLKIANLNGGHGVVRAKHFVLAAGGIENPRLLLASQAVQPTGVGNGHDLVGRFFMEHPHARGARIDTNDPRRLLAALPRGYSREGRRHAAVGRPSESLQRDQCLLNLSFTIGARQHPGDQMITPKKLFLALRRELNPTKRNRRLWHLYRQTVMRLREHAGTTAAAFNLLRGTHGLYTVIRAEQAPNPDSRIRLTGERDALGIPRVALDWRLSPIDKRSVKVTMEALDGELRRLGLGTCTPQPWLEPIGPEWEIDPLISNHPIGGFHHIGTTRMAASPREGVVDADCRVHGIANLYIAGSSVFPTSGWANPTLTIVALALRLAEHLRRAGSQIAQNVSNTGEPPAKVKARNQRKPLRTIRA